MNLPALKEIIEARKEKAIESLSTSFAKSSLPLEEYERLVEYINKIESERELIVVEKMVAEYRRNDAETPAGKAAKETFDDDDEPDMPRRDSSGVNLTILSSRNFSGPLKTGAQFISILGSVCVKVRKADLKKQQTVLNVISVLGDYVVMVESGIRVTNNAVPVLGSSRTNQKVAKEAQTGEPELIISGVALLGDINIKLLKE